jgi:hypothetical protein
MASSWRFTEPDRFGRITRAIGEEPRIKTIET